MVPVCYFLDAETKHLLVVPMVPEALISMLACARLGVTHSVSVSQDAEKSF